MMKDFLNKCGGYGIIDGGFATELERHGVDLNDPLWSAKCLFTSPHLVRRVPLFFFFFNYLFSLTFVSMHFYSYSIDKFLQKKTKKQSRNFVINQESLYTWKKKSREWKR